MPSLNSHAGFSAGRKARFHRRQGTAASRLETEEKAQCHRKHNYDTFSDDSSTRCLTMRPSDFQGDAKSLSIRRRARCLGSESGRRGKLANQRSSGTAIAFVSREWLGFPPFLSRTFGMAAIRRHVHVPDELAVRAAHGRRATVTTFKILNDQPISGERAASRASDGVLL